MFSSMADCYVTSIRRGDVPCVESVLRTTAERENVRAVERSVAVYERLMTDQLDEAPADSVQAFVAAHDRSEREAIEVFAGLVMFDTNGSSRQQLDVSYLQICRHLSITFIIIMHLLCAY